MVFVGLVTCCQGSLKALMKSLVLFPFHSLNHSIQLCCCINFFSFFAISSLQLLVICHSPFWSTSMSSSSTIHFALSLSAYSFSVISFQDQVPYIPPCIFPSSRTKNQNTSSCYIISSRPVASKALSRSGLSTTNLSRLRCLAYAYIYDASHTIPNERCLTPRYGSHSL